MNPLVDATTDRRPAPGQSAIASIWSGVLIVMSGAIFADGAFLTAAYRGSSPVSDERLSYPWDGATAVTTSVVWGAAQVMLVLGLIAFARSDAIVGRAGRAGAWVAVAGASLYVVAHAVSVVFHDADMSDAGAMVALTCFGLGTLLTAIGMIVAGRDVLRAGAWHGWRRFTPIVFGGWMLAMMPLQFTAALVVAVGIYALVTIAFGVAMIESAIPSQQGGRPV